MAKPKPAPQEPNLVALAPEPKPAAKPAARPAETPKVASKATQTAPAPPKEQKSPRWGLWLLVLLVAAATVTAWAQTQRLTQAEGRVTALTEQVLGLQTQLSAANTQIHTFEMQRSQVREAVSDISQRVLMLNELVGGPTAVPQPPPAP